jgi:predicted transposase/invertase (TIGR01784 family)
LLDPKNDFVFKKLFAGAPELLIALINAVRTDAPPILAVEVLNPAISPEDMAGKYIVLDILARDARGRRYNVEMQVRRYHAYSARSTYYLAHALTQQIGSGQNYGEIKSVIGIHLLDFELFDGPGQQSQAVWCFEMRDRCQPEVKLGDELQLNIIEMRKADRLKLAPPELADL